MGHETMRSIIRISGFLLTVAAIVFFVVFIRREWHGLEPEIWSNLQWPLLGLSLLIYVGHLFLHPVAWRILLGFTENNAALRPTTALFLESQFAKYIPGNIAQHLSRVFLSKKLGLPAGAVVLNLMVEAARTSAAGEVNALLAAGVAGMDLLPSGLRQPILATGILAAFFVPVALPRLAKVMIARMPQLKGVHLPDFRPTLLKTMACLAIYAVSFLVLGLMTWLIATALGPPPSAAGRHSLCRHQLAGRISYPRFPGRRRHPGLRPGPLAGHHSSGPGSCPGRRPASPVDRTR
jgi:hypothetical protein